MNVPKVLVATPTFEGKQYIEDKYYNNIKNLTYPNYDILIVDNSATDKYYKHLKRRFGSSGKYVKFHKLDRGKGSRDAHARSYNYIVDYADRNGYDYCMFIESDLIPPKDIIQQLMSWNRLVVGSIYIIGQEGKQNQPLRPCLFKVHEVSKGTYGTRPLDMSDLKDLVNKGLQPIHGCGFGSTLIKTSLLKKFPMYYVEDQKKHADVLFYKDLHNAGYTVYIDTNRIIPHYNSDWDLVKDY